MTLLTLINFWSGIVKTKINLGAGNLIMDTNVYINHDLKKHRPEIELTFDLNKFPYPLEDDTFDEVRIYDVLEHLDHPLEVMNELHRILKNGGMCKLRVASFKSDECWSDLTHKKIYDKNSFDCLDPTTQRGQEYGYYTDRKWKIRDRVYDRCNSAIINMFAIK